MNSARVLELTFINADFLSGLATGVKVKGLPIFGFRLKDFVCLLRSGIHYNDLESVVSSVTLSVAKGIADCRGEVQAKE